MPTGPNAPTDLTRLRREPQCAVTDWGEIKQILRQTYLCHIGFADDTGQAFSVPTIHALIDDHLIIHGSAASRTLRAVSGAARKICVTVAEVDGLVLARSALNHSLNYRSVMVFGEAELIPDGIEKDRLTHAFFEEIFPGRWDEVRAPTEKEMKRMALLKMPLEQASAKVSAGPPEDEDYDYELDVWAGVIPVAHTLGAPQADPQLRAGIEAGSSLAQIAARWRAPAR